MNPNFGKETANHFLITGGGGFIGSYLIENLLGQGKKVTVMDDLSTGSFENIRPFLENPNFNYAIDSISNEPVLDRLASQADTIIHLAAAVGVQLIVNDPVNTIETNIMGTERVLKAALRYRARTIIASTSEVYGKSTQLPFSEENDIVLGPSFKSRWAYAASKLVDEFLALAYWKKYGLPVVIVRFFNTIGPRQTGQYGMVVPRFVKQALQNQPLTVYGDGAQQRCFCDVRDVVLALSALAGHPEAVGKIFNIGSNAEISINQLAEKVIALTKSSSVIKRVPYSEAYAPGFEDMQRRIPDVARIHALIGWKAKLSLDQTIKDIVAQYRATSTT